MPDKDPLIAYKVVRRLGDGGFISAYARVGTKYCLTYEPGKLTTALPGTKLFVFKNLEFAVKFSYSKAGLCVMEVECGDGVERGISVSTSILPAAIDKYWSLKYPNDTHRTGRFTPPEGWISEAPTGTYVCDWVRPIRVIPPKEYESHKEKQDA